MRWLRGARHPRWVGASALAAAATASFFVGGATAAKPAKPNGAPIRQAQVLDLETTTQAAPVGLVFAASSKAFYVVHETKITRLAKTLTPAAPAGFGRIAGVVYDPINVAFDAYYQRLLILSDAGALLETKVGRHGPLDSPLNVGQFDLARPAGMTVDPATGIVFIVDAGAQRIVRIEPQSDGSFREVLTSELDLQSIGIRDARGLAFDPSTGHLQLRGGERLYELTAGGKLVADRDLAGFDLVNPDGMVIAPSADQTDDPSATSLYVADSGGGATGATGRLVELSLAQQVAPQAIDFTSQLVNTVDLGALSPPSPDPSGITYVPGSGLVISDGEVEETVNGITHFQGANVWELTLGGNIQRTANISTVQPTVTPMTDEPAGMAFNPNNGHYFVVADGTRKIFDLNTGADGLIGTADDSWSSFNTDALNSDPEGIAYSTFSGTLFVADGINREVFQYTTGGALLGSFDTLQYGVNHPESVEFNADSGTLFVLSDRSSGTGGQRLVIETTTAGALLRTIDVGASNFYRSSGLTYAPASSGAAEKRFYIIDRVLDNNLDPNAVDGKLYELTAPAPAPPANTPPVVSAGPDRTATLPASVSLDGTATDDGQPNPPGALTTTWTQVSGPGTITFGNPSAVDTTATASAPGVYVVRLTASDSELSAFDEATLTFTGSGGVQILEVSVSAGNDDAEENSANVVSLGNADLDLMSADETNLVVGTRFRNVTIPRGASINNAYVQFTAEEAPHSAATSLTIRGQAADNPPIFAAANGDLSTRPTTTASTAWAVSPWLNVGDAGAAQRSSSLAGIVQEIVNRPGWASGNALVLLVTGSGTRIAESFNKTATPGGNPLLHVEYTTGNSPPQITSDGGGNTAARSVAENQTAVTDVDAVDPNAGDTITYSISGGPDAARFAMNATTGVLTFVSPPNFESPMDAGANNVYDVIVAASDGHGGTDSQSLAVTVLNVNESPAASADYDGDGDSDVAAWRPSEGNWYVRGQFSQQWGLSSDIPVPCDYDADGDNDVAAWRPSEGNWYVRGQFSRQWGVSTDIPVPGDYDGDDDCDVAVWRPAEGNWYVNGQLSRQWGISSDIPVPCDYDGDGDTDVAVWRPSEGNWYVRGLFSQQWGMSTDIPVPGDYDGDGDCDVAVWRPSEGNWYVHGQFSQQWGISSDVPVPGDYDGDGDTDVAVWRPVEANWYVRGQFSQQWGTPTDFPLALPWAIYERYY